MRSIKIIGLAAISAAAALTACSSSGSPSASSTSAQPPSAPSSAPAAALTCQDIATVMTPVIADQKSQDASQTQDWVNLVPSNSGGSNLTSQGQDLQTAITSIGNITGTDTLTGDLQAFAAGGNTFLTDQGDGLMPGSTAEYNQLKSDIYAIGSVCGIS